MILGAGDTFIAIRLLLKLVAAKQILLPPHLVQQCSTWLDAYALHEEQENLRRLIEGLLIGDAIQGSTAIGRPSATPKRKRCLRLPAHFALGASPRNVPQLVVFFDRTEPTHTRTAELSAELGGKARQPTAPKSRRR